jgi:uncharacterized protein YgiM (DUF1202 family)
LTPPRPKTETGYYRVVGVADNDVLNVRAGAGLGNIIVGEIPPDGKCVEYLARGTAPNGKTWYRVRYGPVTGWVRSKFLFRTGGCGSGADVVPGDVYYRVSNVNENDVLNIRANPGVGSPRVGDIPHNGTCVKFLSSTKLPSRGTWFRISYKNQEGWVNSFYLTRVEGCEDE